MFIVTGACRAFPLHVSKINKNTSTTINKNTKKIQIQIQIQKRIKTQLQKRFLILLFHILENVTLGRTSPFGCQVQSKPGFLSLLLMFFVFYLDWIYIIRIVFTLPDITFYI